jgi:hypothetical protein
MKKMMKCLSQEPKKKVNEAVGENYPTPEENAAKIKDKVIKTFETNLRNALEEELGDKWNISDAGRGVEGDMKTLLIQNKMIKGKMVEVSSYFMKVKEMLKGKNAYKVFIDITDAEGFYWDKLYSVNKKTIVNLDKESWVMTEKLYRLIQDFVSSVKSFLKGTGGRAEMEKSWLVDEEGVVEAKTRKRK